MLSIRKYRETKNTKYLFTKGIKEYDEAICALKYLEIKIKNKDPSFKGFFTMSNLGHDS